LEQNLEHIILGCKAYQAPMQEALYHYCYANMLGVCLRYTNNRDDAAALYNEAMLKVLTAIDQYDGKGAFLGWVRRITVNTCIDYCRKQIKYSIRPMEEQHEQQVYVESYMEHKISNEEVVRLIQELPKNTGLVFNLYAIEGYKFDEIVNALGITVGTAKWHVSEARKSLKEKLHFFTNSVIKANANAQ
jgi:RNA polymerase sigma-70 factor, ECF subfamily